MAGFFALIGKLSKLIDFVGWLAEHLKRWLVERATARRVKKVGEAIQKARGAKTVQEKAEAACDLEKTLNPDSDCDQPPARRGN